MTRYRILIAALAAAFAAGGMNAATGAGTKDGVSGVGTPVGKKEAFSKLDTDNDGFLGRIEAAADADAKSKFEKLDKNKDGKLSRSEYDAWGKTGASAGATAKSGR